MRGSSKVNPGRESRPQGPGGLGADVRKQPFSGRVRATKIDFQENPGSPTVRLYQVEPAESRGASAPVVSVEPLSETIIRERLSAAPKIARPQAPGGLNDPQQQRQLDKDSPRNQEFSSSPDENVEVRSPSYNYGSGAALTRNLVGAILAASHHHNPVTTFPLRLIQGLIGTLE